MRTILCSAHQFCQLESVYHSRLLKTEEYRVCVPLASAPQNRGVPGRWFLSTNYKSKHKERILSTFATNLCVLLCEGVVTFYV